MKTRRTVKINKLFLLILVFLFAIIILRLSYIVLSPKVDGINLTAFASSRNTYEEKIVAERGTIYDSTGNTLAVNVNSYTVIAYLDSSRTTDKDNPHHVVDKEATAKALSPLINMTEERILDLLNTEDVYQVELGPGGRGITELLKDTIEDLNLPGIDFVKSVKRYYPNRDFLSYTLGYAKTLEDGSMTGEMGIELLYNEELTGTDGSRKYEGDVYGYKMANTNEEVVEAINGNDMYLTIDTNVQLLVEQAINTLESNSSNEWATISVMNAKTGEILGVASTPSFDPNTKEIVNYYDPFVSFTYEPGSTMKTFTWMAAIENGLYDEEETYMSGQITIGEYTIKEFNKYGWGTITFDQGYLGSSNVGATKLSQKLGAATLKDFYKKAGFGTKTGIELPGEKNGSLNFKYDIEVANASFGQGISITQIQMLQALTSIANEGTVVKPYIIKKVVNSNTGETILENKRTEVSKIASKETIDKVKELMYGVVNDTNSIATGLSYRTSKVTTIGKTGTAEIASSDGGYLTGYYDYIRSFTGLFPYEDPEYIVYIVASKNTNPTIIPTVTKTLIDDLSTYLGITEVINESTISSNKISSYINKDVSKSVEELNSKNIETVVIGTGTKVIDQYPKNGTIVSVNNKVFLLTNSTNYTYLDINGWSRGDLINYGNLLNVTFNITGYGYVYDSNIFGRAVIPNEVIDVNLKIKYAESTNIDE